VGYSDSKHFSLAHHIDVVLFSLLNREYSSCIRDLACKRVFHINKEGFLLAFKDAFFKVST
jgi:hypothetical protein